MTVGFDELITQHKSHPHMNNMAMGDLGICIEGRDKKYIQLYQAGTYQALLNVLSNCPILFKD